MTVSTTKDSTVFGTATSTSIAYSPMLRGDRAEPWNSEVYYGLVGFLLLCSSVQIQTNILMNKQISVVPR